MRCRFKIEDNKVTATTKYAGNVINASAKCDPSDIFDENCGKMLAEKRLNVKVCSKRERYYTKLMKTYNNELFELSKKFSKICNKRGIAVEQLHAAEEELDDYLMQINS